MKIAILDDYFSRAQYYADWGSSDDLNFTFFDSHVSDTHKLIEMLTPFDAVGLMRERTPFPKVIIDALPNLKLIVTSGMRNAAIDLDAAKAKGVVVCGTSSPGHATAELAFMLIMMLCRRVMPLINGLKHNNVWQPMMGHDVRGKTLGIVGLGRLGTYVAKLGQAFGMNVIAWSSNLDANHANALGVQAVKKADLFTRADLVSIHYKLSDRSRGLIGEEELKLLGPEGHIVNTSRAEIINQAALLRCLDNGSLGGLATDVYAEEPATNADKLVKHPRVIATPHVGYCTEETFTIFYQEMLAAFEAYEKGQPINIIN
ncbi:MAG: D-2-hydroxyacid dehydrogenase family protein [Oceanospirillales bacterium TMED33]|nr:hydroxyacid dehydrogenase [Gammaproteobacteria bacterium]RPG19292.1 MAG: D-2-hydroxyacid dehydrogenase family protein [Oceanospirillales bacterium TMED33]|tara:strand:- start:868 stop:1815 length:948 start_codon:yes stop_codon:yes gene_type:complete